MNSYLEIYKLLSTRGNTKMATYYRSKIGEVKSLEDWERWAKDFYQDAYREDYQGLPSDWMAKITKVLKLEQLEL
jgi:hypothetical protein